MFSNHYSTSDLFLAIFCIAYILGLFHKSWLKSVFWDNFPYLLTLQGALLIVCKELLSLWYARSSFNSVQRAPFTIVCKKLYVMVRHYYSAGKGHFFKIFTQTTPNGNNSCQCCCCNDHPDGWVYVMKWLGMIRLNNYPSVKNG